MSEENAKGEKNQNAAETATKLLSLLEPRQTKNIPQEEEVLSVHWKNGALGVIPEEKKKIIAPTNAIESLHRQETRGATRGQFTKGIT